MWKIVKLGDVIEKGETINPTTNPDIQFTYIDVSSIDRMSFSISETQTLLGKDAPSRARRAVRTGDVLFATIRPTLQRVAIVPEELNGEVCSTGYIVLRPNSSILCSKFIFYYMLSEKVKAEMEGLQTGASYPAVNDTQVKNLHISYPPLAEQQRIVTKLDAAFAEIDTAIEVAEAKEAEVEKLKASLLSASLSAGAVMWKIETIGDVLSVIQNGVNCTQDKSGKGLKITRIETIADANINYDKTGFSNLDESQRQKAALKKGDILFSHINSPIHVGKTAIYDGSEPLYHGINLLRLRTIEAVDSNYFNYFLQSLFWSGYWRRTAKQSVNQASVNQADIKKIPFSYPPLAEQQRIVAKLDAAFAEVNSAKQAIQRAKENHAALKAAILAQELTPPAESEAA